MSFAALNIIVNSVLLLISFITVGIMLRAGASYAYNYGNTPVQEKLKILILKLIVILVVVGLIASVFNIVAPYFI